MKTSPTVFSTSRGMLLFAVLSSCLLAVSAQTNSPGVKSYPWCVVTCKDSLGQNLPEGNYASCERCNAYISCSNGYNNTMECALGTNYYDRVLGQCVVDRSVCVNDSLPTSQPDVTASPATTTSTTLSTTPQTTTSVTTPPTQAPTTQTTPTVPSTTTTTTSATISVTTEVFYSNKTGYRPSSESETESFWFAVDMYNSYSHERMRAGALSVSRSTAESIFSGAQPSLTTWYRFYGVVFVPTQCTNTAENMSADYNKCPLSVGPQVAVAKCDFKVHYFPQKPVSSRLNMTYMMCYQ